MKADRAEVLKRLRIARGQVDAAVRMVEDDRYCIDISNQLLAAEKLVAKANAAVLKAHVEDCVAGVCESGTDEQRAEKLSEIAGVIDTLANK